MDRDVFNKKRLETSKIVEMYFTKGFHIENVLKNIQWGKKQFPNPILAVE